MPPELTKRLPSFLERVGLDEEPMGIFYTDTQPDHGFSPKPADLPTREREIANEIDWQAMFGQFSCALGHIWCARRKKTAAWFDPEHFGCPGAALLSPSALMPRGLTNSSQKWQSLELEADERKKPGFG